jgi:hypothetical protein
MELTNEEYDILECMVDKYSMASILSALSNICCDKVEHIATNWQDASLAKVWAKRANVIEKVNQNSCFNEVAQ